MKGQKNPVLRDFKEIPAAYRSAQERSLDWLASAHAIVHGKANSRERVRKAFSHFGADSSKIAFRAHEPEDFLHENWDRMIIYPLLKNREGAPLEDRNRFFHQAALRTFQTALAEKASPPSELIHVTCTGYHSPSAAQLAVSERGWGEHTRVTHLYHMGCSAAIPAIRLASASAATVQIIHTELCTIHLNPAQDSPEQLVIQSLFSDGMIAYSVGPGEGIFEILSTREEITPASTRAMTWSLGAHGFLMGLSREVPELVSAALPGFLRRLCPELKLSDARFAIHPGGPRIIDLVASKLELTPDQVQHSRSVLYDFGNMSSATLPHIWSRMAQDPGIKPGMFIVSLAFGPGLTLAGALLRKR